MTPFKTFTCKLIFFPLLPDGRNQFTIPELGPEEIQAAVFDEINGLPGGFFCLAGEPDNEIPKGGDVILV